MSILGYRPHKPKILESKIQEKVVEHARKNYKGKVIVIKRQSGKFGTNGWPDYEFLIKNGKVFHIEFKRPGEKPTKLQADRIKELRKLGHRVYVIDNVVEGMETVDQEMSLALRPA